MVDCTQMLNIDRYTQLLIHQMAKPSNFAPVVLDDDVNGFVNSWKKTREHTASGRSGLHFGHFIAACNHSQLKQIEHQQAQFPLATGYSPKRWQQGIEVMLLKQSNNFHVNKLGAILLFEADFNHNNKRIGRELMRHGEANQWMAQEQYGSRKLLAAIDHCLNKQLSFDIVSQYKTPAAVCVNDMKGCYDRIVHSVASICMQRLGVNIKTLQSMFFTLQHLEHDICTAYGESEKSFQASEIHTTAIQGIGQGNGADPQIWAAISTGGQLEPSKTYWYNIDFRWQQGKWRFASLAETWSQLTTEDSMQERQVLEQVDIVEGRRTLGVRLAPDGNNKEEFTYLKEQSDQWADKIRSRTIPKVFTWQAFTSTILAKLSYAIPATILTQGQIQSDNQAAGQCYTVKMRDQPTFATRFSI
jgi:hypothetical protein